MKTKTAAIAAGLSASAAVAQSSCSNILTPNYNTPTVAAGWQAQLVVGGLTKPRSIEFDDTGALLVVESGKGVTRHTFVDNGGTCLTVEKSDLLIDEPTLNHGLAIDPNGRVIYASSAESVFRYEFNARTSSVNSNPSVLVNKMSNNDLVTRTLLLSKKQRGTLLVSRGVPDGDELRAETLSNGLSQIRAFDLNNLTTSSSSDAHTYNFNTEGQVLGWGLRNSVGVAEHPVTGGIFAVENSMDGVTRNGQDIHENNPGEELNYLGILGKDSFGKNYGFPSCFAVWDLNEIPENGGLKIGDQFATDEDKITDEVCNDSGRYEKPRLVMPAHWAPLDIKFDVGGEVAYVSFHGSFNKKSPAGYRISAIPFDASSGQPKASAQQSHDASAMIDIMANPDNTVCPGNCFRPAGLAFDSAGRLWMSSDTTGEIFVLQKTDSTAGVFVMPQGAGTGGKANAAGRLSGGMGWGYLAGLVVAGWFALF